jgi:LuxR family maltose regulon positive regulatory protein
MKALPDDVVRHRPWLRLFIARTLYVSGQWEKTDQMLQDLEDWLYEHPETPEAQRLLALVVADRAGHALVRGEVRKGRELVQRMLAQASPDELLIQVRAESMLGMAHVRLGEVMEAQHAFSRAIGAAPAGRIGYAIAPIICNLAETYYLQGQLRQAWQACEQANEAGTVDGQPHATTGFAGLMQGRVLYEWNDLEAAEQRLQEGLDLLRRGGIGSHFGNLYATLAQTKQARGDHGGARSTIEQAVQTARGANIPRLLIQALACQARIWLAQGELELARRWAHGYRQLGDTEYIRDFEDCTLARVLLADDQPGEALALLEGMAPSADDDGRRGTLIEILALRALARRAHGDPGEESALPDDRARMPGEQDVALEDLARALDLAEPEGYARTFLDLGEPMAALLRQVASRGISPAYSSKLLAAFGAERKRGLTAAPSGAQPLVEPLSDRELEVLQLLADGLSNPEIGRRLFISLPTVKSHTRNIYGKLGVHSRKQAVAQARALGILLPL